MKLIDDNVINPLINNLFPLKPKILGANLGIWLSQYGYENVKKMQYNSNSSSNPSVPVWPNDLTDFSQILLLKCSTGNRNYVNDNSGFSYALYCPILCNPKHTTVDGTDYIGCISIPNTNYTKVIIPPQKDSTSVEANEDNFTPLIDPKTFLTTKKLYYSSNGYFYSYNQNGTLIPGGGNLVLWYLPNDYTIKEN